MKIVALIFILCNSFMFAQNSTFKAEQLKFSRVRTAYNEKENKVKEYFKDSNIDYNSKYEILFIAYKDEKLFEVWIKEKNDEKYKLLKSYNICSSSGVLGPKRKQGDSQVPEGFYHIDRFNPMSNFYLSLGINYPNSSDKILGKKDNLGGDIFIHGSCVTIGCIPLTDNIIKEVYILAVEAKSKGLNKIPVYIYPCKLSNENFEKILNIEKNIKVIDLWTNIKKGYEYFNSKNQEIKYSINTLGEYIINN